MRSSLLAIAFVSMLLSFASAQPADTGATATIRIAAEPAGKVSRYLTGACIEDVNHEIYGGIYSQMIFGESFQEPPAHRPVKGFTAFDGTWTVDNGELSGSAGSGPTLVSDRPAFTNGEVEVEIFFADRAAGNAGLILRTGRVGTGADNFTGYEVSLYPSTNILLLGRHRQNWEPIREVPCPVPVGKWVRLVVRLHDTTLDVQVDGKNLLTYEDREHPLRSGGLGLRQWQRPARYRNLSVKIDGQTEAIPFEANRNDLGPVSGMWRGFSRGTATGSCAVVTDRPFLGTRSQRLAFTGGEGVMGMVNAGLNRWGLGLVAGKPYEGHLWVRAEKPVEIAVALESLDGGKPCAQARLKVTGEDWQRLDFKLTPDRPDRAARFTVTLWQPGSVEVGYVFLQPGEWGRFKGLPVRRDVVQGLQDQGLTVLRYGGSMVNAGQYRWKKMIGPRDRRPPYAGTWYPYSSNGWGIVDFLDLCEAAGFLGIPDFNIDETPQDMADFLAYANGPADSAWGKRRAADGHSAPYRLKYVELGNEEKVDEKYAEKFRAIAEAMWAVDPDIILVVGDFSYGQPITDPDHVKGAASGITSLAGHRKILELARKHGREVWFDVHLWSERPDALNEVDVLPTYLDAIDRLAEGARHKVVVFELNADSHGLARGLANAITLGKIERLGDRVPIVCSANCLQPNGQNDNGWNQGLLFLDPTHVWSQPPGEVERMIAGSYQPVGLSAKVPGGGRLEVVAARSEDGKTLVVRAVNRGDSPASYRFDLGGFTPRNPVATIDELAGPMDAANTAEEPRRILSQRSRWQHELDGHAPPYVFPARSFTVLTFR